MIAVQLSPEEMAIASIVGGFRQAESLRSNRRDAHGMPDDHDGLACHILGAAGEMAVAKVLGRYWAGDVCTFKRPDVGANVQVRTRSRETYDLIVRDDDADEDWFVLVTGNGSKLNVHGFIRGADAKRPEWRAPPRRKTARVLRPENRTPTAGEESMSSSSESSALGRARAAYPK